ncbi:MAG: DegT/DnrJ/EryC1/StrS family aminotransferase [Candidatus Omnitrophica bacterium]|nr:DegT/DnrJ/EryC1/StrS family aminotransferase [Candidatus Omnitrophota bacterium]
MSPTLTGLQQPSPAAFQSFRIGFDPRDIPCVMASWEEIFRSQQWVEGKFTRLFEDKWATWNGLPAVATSSWAGAAMACLDYFGLKGKQVLCPTNTFMATPLSVLKVGGEVVFGDCNREDLCLSYEAVVLAAKQHPDLAAVWLVHIGGHIAFDVERIAAFCRERGIVLLEDCAHAQGASWHGNKPGTWGDAGAYSFYGTKTISTGEGGMLVSKHPELIEFARRYRNYGKPSYEVEGLNYRMSEFTAALGVVQTDRLEEIVAWKDRVAREVLHPRYAQRVQLPEGMVSGWYKYIVFEPIERSTGKVYDQLCHTILKYPGSFPNSEWVARNHWCVPLYYHPDLTDEGVRA